jgi:dolichyl-phosphate-mannose-protein mannosyltransferase
MATRVSAEPRALRDLVRSRSAAWSLVLGGAVAAGIALHLWVLHAFGAIESDEAIVGLMAQDVLHGDFHVFFWLQYYSGTQEVLLTALVFALVGSSVIALKLVPIALFAAAAVVTWRIGIRTVGEPAARVGAALLWVWPPFFVYHSAKARAAYGIGLLCASIALLFVLRLRERDSRLDAVLLGLALGCGIWSTPQALVMPLPALAWLAWRRPRAFRLAPYALLGGLVGGAPWIAWNVTHRFKGVFPASSLAGEGSTFWSRLSDLFTKVLPEGLGLRLPFTLDWILPVALGAALTALAIAAFLWLLAQRPPGTEPLLVIGAVYPVVYAASSFTYFTDEPRYLTFVLPVPALLIGRYLARLPLAAIGIGIATALSAIYLVKLEHQGRFRFIGQPDNMQPLIGLLERKGQNRVFADYWVAYRIDFESNERIIATSTGFSRNADYDRIVRAAPNPAYVFVAGSAAERGQRGRLLSRGYERRAVGGWAAYLHG